MEEIILKVLAFCIATLTYNPNDFDCGAFSLSLIEELEKQGITSTVLVIAQNENWAPDGYYKVRKAELPSGLRYALRNREKEFGLGKMYTWAGVEYNSMIVYPKAGLYYYLERIPNSPKKIIEHYGINMQENVAHVWVLETTTGMVLDASPTWQNVANPRISDKVEF